MFERENYNVEFKEIVEKFVEKTLNTFLITIMDK